MTRKVLVSGAGIAGPTLAYFLSKAGMHVTVCEKADTLYPHGQNIDISGSARLVIEKMGLREEVLKQNTTEIGTQLVNEDGSPFAQFPTNEGKSFSPTSDWEILRGDLAQILYNKTKNDPNVTYRFSTVISSVLENDEDKVKVEFGNSEVAEFDTLIAADGQWSKIRKQVFSPDQLTVIDKGLYIAYYTIPKGSSDNKWWNIYNPGGARTVMTRPDPYGTIRATLSHMPTSAEEKEAWQKASRSGREAQEKIMKEHFRDVGWETQRILAGMSSAPDFYFQAIQQIKLSKWSNGRVVCVGDTAYAPTPLTGQGTSLALVGSYVLAGEISRSPPDAHPKEAFESYDRKFRPFVEKQQYIPFFVPAIGHPVSAYKVWCLKQFVSLAAVLVGLYSKLPGLPFRGTVKTESVHGGEDFPLDQYGFEATKE